MEHPTLTISEADLSRIVDEAVERILAGDFLDDWASAISEFTPGALEAERTQARRAIDKARVRIERLITAIENGTLEPEDIEDRLPRLKAEIAANQARLADLEDPDQPSFEETRLRLTEISGALAAAPEMRPRLLRALGLCLLYSRGEDNEHVVDLAQEDRSQSWRDLSVGGGT